MANKGMVWLGRFEIWGKHDRFFKDDVYLDTNRPKNTYVRISKRGTWGFERMVRLENININLRTVFSEL